MKKKTSKEKKRLENLIHPDISDNQAVLLRGINEETDGCYCGQKRMKCSETDGSLL